AGDLGDHQGQQGVGGDVEGYPEEDVGAALVELAGRGPVRQRGRKPRMAGGEGHLAPGGVLGGGQALVGQVGRVPGADDQPARVGPGADLGHHLADLVEGGAVRAGPGTPLVAVHRPELPRRGRPLVPDGDAVLLQIGDVGVAPEEPQQFMDDGLEMDLLGGHQRKPLRQIEAHLVAEHTEGAGAGAVALLDTLVAHPGEQIEVLLHGDTLSAPTYCLRVKPQTSRATPATIIGRLSTWPRVIQPRRSKPMWVSGSRTNSTAKRASPYSSRNRPLTTPTGRGLRL